MGTSGWIFCTNRIQLSVSNSGVLEHLIDCGPQIEQTTALKPLPEIPGFYKTGLRRQLQMRSLAIANRLMKPELRKQHNLVQSLLLPWP